MLTFFSYLSWFQIVLLVVTLMTGLLSLFREVILIRDPDRGKDYKLFWRCVFIAFIISSVWLWIAEHQKTLDLQAQVDAKLTYILPVTSLAKIPQGSSVLFQENLRPSLTFGMKNDGSYMANNEYSVQALVSHAPAHPFRQSLIDPDRRTTSRQIESEVWEQFKKTRLSAEHGEHSEDPGEEWDSTAYGDHILSADETSKLRLGDESIMYLVGFVKWTDAAGTHERRFCWWIHPPANTNPVVRDECLSHNEFLEKPEE